MTVDTDQKHQEKIEAASNMICQLKQIYQLNKGHAKMYILSVEEVLHVSSYPMLEPMVFDADISAGFAKMRAATLLGENVRLHKCTKNPLNYVHTNSKYGHLVVIPYFETPESFSRSARYKGWVGKILLHLSGGKE